eukprot:scaffold10974_cov154-Skeletonema_marinoi.AAC.8
METSLSTPPQLPNQMEEDASKYNEREGEGDGREEDEWAVLPDGEEQDEEMGMGNDADVSEGLNHAGDDDDDGGVSASGAANKVITVEECLKSDFPLHRACQGGVFGTSLEVIKYLVEEADGDKGKELLCRGDGFGRYPLHLACEGGASLEVIKYLVEEADGDKGKELLGKVDRYGFYPLHHACYVGATLEVIKYLVEEADGDKRKELLCKKDIDGMYPLHWACKGGASVDVIKYLVEEADGDKGEEPLSKWDNFYDMYPLHWACKEGASVDVIKYLIQKNPVPLQHRDRNGLNCLDSMNSDILREIWGRTHQIGTVADKSSDKDRLNYLLYARALVYAARQAEQSGTSLCVGLFGRWGGGKSTLWKQIQKCLQAEFFQEDALLLYNIYQLSGESLHPLLRKAAKNAEKPFNNAVERLASDPYVLNDAKEAWREKSEGPPPTTSLTFLEHLAWLFLRIFCACQSCREGYELENVPRNVDDVHIQRAQIKSQDARSRRMEMNAIFFSEEDLHSM